jgi:hypothetical protein
MLNIIKADLFRIFKGKGIYICIFSVILLCSVSIYLRAPGHIGLTNESALNLALEEYQDIETPEDVRKIAGESEMLLDEGMMKTNGNLYYPLIFIAFVVVCVDLSSHTVKNIISTDVSRKTYYFAKLLLTWGLGIFLIILSTYFGYFGNIIFNNPSNVSNILDITIIMLRQLPIFCGIMSVLVMLATVTKKTSRYNAIAIILVMLSQMLIMLVITIFKIDSNMIMQFEFETIIRSLAVVGSIELKTLLIGVLMGLGLTVGSSIIGIYYFNRCDIK